MAKQTATVEVKSFIKGLITEADQLTFPDNASVDELNLVLNKDGSRKRRNGMDFEDGYQWVDTGQGLADDMSVSSFSWKNPGGFADKEFVVIQTGARLTFADASAEVVSSGYRQSFDLGIGTSDVVSMTAVDGILIVVCGVSDIFTFVYDGSTITKSTGRLKIRDLFGVADTVAGVNLLDGNNITVRPTSTTNAHTYNLRNQTFALNRVQETGDATNVGDPLGYTFQNSGKYPSNADNITSFLYADANNEDNRTVKRFFVEDLVANPLGTTRAPVGYFIIDALNRGASRLSSVQQLEASQHLITDHVTSLPSDITPGGASVVASFSGRVFFAGFSSQLEDGDTQSPRMTSYVLFSQLVQTSSDVYKCYQAGDPTSTDTPDLIDTDGGFIRLDGAYNIQQMINVGDSIMVVAENGVWKITGGSGYGFKATDYLTSKITEHGSISPHSVVIIDNTFMYWSDDGIYHAAPNQYGDWQVNNLTNTTIQAYFDDIDFLTKQRCQGMYDSYSRQVRWLYNNYFGAASNAKELIMDLNLNAFYPSEIGNIGDNFPRPLAMIRVPPYRVGNMNVPIITGDGETVYNAALTDAVTVARNIAESQTSEIFYVCAVGASDGVLNVSFAFYKDDTFRDWKSVDGVGVDAPAYVLTGWAGMGDFQRQKQVPYITVYSVKTESGFDTSYVPVNSSSILLQSQWNWTNLAESGKWGPQIQAYRHRRLWTPATSGAGFDDGEGVVVTRNKLRGRGRVLSLRFDTEPYKDFHLLGWSFIVNVNGSV